MSNERIENLTPEQEALIPLYQDKWRKIALSTERIDRVKAADAVKAAYELIGVPKPEIIFFDSLYAAARHVYWGISYSKLDYNLLPQLHNKLPNILVVDEDEQLFEQIRQVEMILVSEAKERLEEEGEELCYDFHEGHMQTDILCWECGWFDFCVSVSEEKYLEWEIYQNLLRHCGRIYAYKEACIVCDRPTKLSFDNQNRLHAEAEPAIEFADGFKVYAHHGVHLPEKYGKIHPQHWQPQWLLEEDNAELRRVLIQGIGYTRIIAELQATELDTWQEYTLLKIDKHVDVEPIYLLKMTCPSTDFIHVLRVPPDMQSAREAIRWVNWGIEPEDFAVQT